MEQLEKGYSQNIKQKFEACIYFVTVNIIFSSILLSYVSIKNNLYLAGLQTSINHNTICRVILFCFTQLPLSDISV
jgi:hypothetical protein